MTKGIGNQKEQVLNNDSNFVIYLDQEILADLIDIFWNNKSFVKDGN